MEHHLSNIFHLHFFYMHNLLFRQNDLEWIHKIHDLQDLYNFGYMLFLFRIDHDKKLKE